jgi:hypothetical protein
VTAARYPRSAPSGPIDNVVQAIPEQHLQVARINLHSGVICMSHALRRFYRIAG